MAQQYLVANSFLGLGLEGSYSGSTWTPNRNSLASSITYIPITGPQLTPMQTFLRDEALRGSPVMPYDQILGVRHDEYDVKGYVFADSFPILTRAILGSVDVVSGTSPTYTHTQGVLNDYTQGSQPPSVSIQDFDGANAFQMLGAQASDLNVTFGAEVASEWSAKFVGNPATNPSRPSPSFSTETYVPGWDVSISINGTTVGFVQEGEIKMDRKSAPVFTMGTTAPHVNFAGPVEVTGRLLMVTEGQTDPFIIGSTPYALSRNAQPIVITLTDPVTTHSVRFQMTGTQFHDVKRNRGKEYVETEANFTVNATNTDAVSGGYSPIKVVTTNATSALY